MRIFPAIALGLLATSATAQSGQVENCWSDRISVEPLEFSKAVIEGREVKARVTYHEGAPLSAMEIAFEIWSDKRPLPLYSSHLRDLRSIDGGLMLGESLVTSDYHFMDAREKALAEEAGELSVRFEVQGAKDVSGQALSCN